MSNLNWPEGATHYLQDGEEQTRFRDLSGEQWKYFNSYIGEWVQHYFSSEDLLRRHDLIARPQPKPWSGPEDGLPQSSWCSAGKMVQVMSLPTHHHEDVSIYLSKPSKIVASYTDDEGDTFLMLRIDCDFGTGYECFAAHRVLPAKTENQLAAENRESAIRELMDIAQVDCRVTAARLVDAGFKREVV